jgi:exodeoxyribonuclease-5
MDPSGERVRELEEELRLLEAVAEPTPSLLQRAEAVRRALREARAEAGRPQFVLKEESEVHAYELVILDEASMVDERMGSDLLSFGVKVLVLGDPAQLPPVRGTGYFTTEAFPARPEALLTEIHRQAAGNPIIRMATDVREGRALREGEWVTDQGSARVVRRVSKEEALAADQILCGTNARRRAINTRHRELGGHLGRGPMPAAGEKLVCLRNNRDRGLLNGTLWRSLADTEWQAGDDLVDLRVDGGEGGPEMGFPAEASIFLDEDQKPQWGRGEWFTYGYALTVHKSQGSQFNNVIVFDDWRQSSSDYKNWMYTAITRAAERLTVVKI